MCSVIIIFMFLISGSFYGAVCHNKKFEEILPLTIMTAVVIEFVFGMMHRLYLGFLVCMILSVALYIISGIRLFKTNSAFNVRNNFLTPAFFLFSIIYIFIIVLNYGKKATDIDEFSHWIECVKSMVILDDFSTNPLSHDDYRSYPPGMALFQYLVQRINLALTSNGSSFSEWRVYVAYKLFYTSLIFPFLKKFQWRRIYIALLAIIGLCLTPSVFYEYIFRTLTIDPFVAMFAGVGIATVIIIAEKDLFSLYSITLICVNLYLAKDVGIIFSIFIIIIYALKINNFNSYVTWNKRLLTNILFVGVPAFFLLCFRLMWAFELRITGAKINNVQQFRIREFFEYLIFHNGTDYKQTIVDNFSEALFNSDIACVAFMGGHLKFNYAYLSLALIVLLILDNIVNIYVIRACDKDSENSRTIKFRWIAVGTLSFLLIFYVLAIGIFFTSSTEYSAVRLMSFSRYMNIAYMALWIYLVIDLICIVFDRILCIRNNMGKTGILSSVVFTSLLLCVFIDFDELGKYITRTNVKESVEARVQFDELSNKILNTCAVDDKIYFVSRAHTGEHSGGHGLYFNIVKFNVEPITITVDKRNQWDGWGLGPALSNDDIWYLDISSKEWFRVLKDEGYTYVAIFRKGDDLYENFGNLFENHDAVQDDSLYKIDFTDEILRRVDIDG